MPDITEPSSFRDPAGVVFSRDGILYRQINPSGGDDYTHLMESGLYAALVADDLLIPHEAVGRDERHSDTARVVIRPQRIPFVSYPYEWCFSQLKDAALLTLRLQKEALGFGMSLKDASAYNIQFRHGCRPIFIDTLSFARYIEGAPWEAYRQFCQHFVAPLALMAHVDIRLSHLLQTAIDGVPLDLAARLLPLRDRLDPALLPHVYLHSAAQQRHADTSAAASASSSAPSPSGRMSLNALRGLLDSLESGIRRLTWQPRGTEWSDYYDNTNYAAEAFQTKKQMVAGFLAEVTPTPRGVYDLGANTGVFSRIASEQGIPTFAFDVDAAAVEKNYRTCQASRERDLLPLVQDLTNPSPALGWAHEERRSFLARCGNGPADVALALALVHHLAISNNVPLSRIADMLGRVAPVLIIEFVPKEDSQVRRLLSRREDIFPDYTLEGFEAAFAARFDVRQRETIPGTERTLYRMRRKDAPG